jgi:hypothetical protein
VNIEPIAASGAAVAASRSDGQNGNANGKESAPAKDKSGNGSDRPEMPPASETPAPSIGPNTVIEKEPPEERLSRHEVSQTDAMGLDKRRAVVGGKYSPSIARQATLYGLFIAVTAALVVGFVVLANELDKPPDVYEEAAPWTNSETPAAPIDFPQLGEPAPETQANP